MYYSYTNTPAGEMLLISDGKKITGMHWTVFKRAPRPTSDWIERPELFESVIAQLQEYFAGKREDFAIDFAVTGTPFQQAVWKELSNISYGQTTTYLAIANAVGKPKAVRAVGTAIGSNPMSIVVPCHRVLASDGTLGGYAGGLAGKQILLKNETAASLLPV